MARPVLMVGPGAVFPRPLMRQIDRGKFFALSKVFICDEIMDLTKRERFYYEWKAVHGSFLYTHCVMFFSIYYAHVHKHLPFLGILEWLY